MWILKVLFNDKCEVHAPSGVYVAYLIDTVAWFPLLLYKPMNRP